MNAGRTEAGRALERLFGAGAVGTLSDAELIERFATGDDESAGAAFEAIVGRHGPTVLRVCLAVLRDAHAADDAFQATFLVLARRARALGDRDRLGSWLYGVALRTSRKARAAAARRAARDRAAAARRSEAVVEPTPDDRGEPEPCRILHEEIGRLPDSYRAVVVACYFEGLTHAQAARRLRLAESTVRGRLARARKRLGRRLGRRGVAPEVLLTAPAAARLPEVTVRSLARDALHFARSAGPAGPGAVASTASALADGVLSTMWLPSLKIIVIAAATAAAGLGLIVAPAADPPAPAADVDPDLAKKAPGPIVRAVPISKDQMVLSYLPDWNFGRVDNIGIGDNGCRTLLAWPRVDAAEAADTGRRFLLAIYARKVASNPPAGPIGACEILGDWGEQTSSSTRPDYQVEPFATSKFEPGEGWKLFDVTALVRARSRGGQSPHGVLLRFLQEDVPPSRASTYFLVSREGKGEWLRRRPVLPVVEGAK